MNLVHNNERVTALFEEGREFVTLQTVFNGTQAECDAEIRWAGLSCESEWFKIVISRQILIHIIDRKRHSKIRHGPGAVEADGDSKALAGRE